MLEIEEENGLIRIKAGGTLESSDYDRFVPLFERIAAIEQGTVPMVIELAPDFSGWDLGGIWRDLRFDVMHKDQFGRIAIIGTRDWHEWATKLSDVLFPPAEMRFFDPDAGGRAERWARTGAEGESNAE
ncbi:STAS/SEC14 domain-containing protein [Sphingosinithalassobacter sp. LHW66-3]|uniref:STAS/SEC14 domain-containing protein n=1 Tax=Sphingosinithalassobacter sp. LHW66-3 TaxID=3424718 RepID=UPI003D6AFB60